MSTDELDEIGAAQAWIIGLLKADGALTTLLGSAAHYGDLAPQGTAQPYTVTSYQAGHDEDAVAGDLGATALVMLVKCVTQDSSFDLAAKVSKRIQTLLHGKSGTVTGWQILECRREQPVRYPEINNGIRYNHLGRTYRIWIQAG